MDQTSELMSSIYRDLHHAVGYWEVRKEVIRQLSQRPTGRPEFFYFAQRALLDSTLLAISRVLDEGRRTASIPRLRKTDQRLSAGALKQRLAQFDSEHGPTLEKVKQRRDQHISHQDRVKHEPNDPLVSAEIDKLMDSLIDIFREFGGSLQDTDYDFSHVRESSKRESAEVMEILQQDWESRSPAKRRLRAD